MNGSDRLIYLYRDFLGDPDLGNGNPRDVEDSRDVVHYWFDSNARYAIEDISDARCLRLVAERLVVRRILGIGSIDAAFESQVARTEVFGPGTPIFSELVMPSVFIAMAFVPLKSAAVDGNPRLVRLYCVGGLETQHMLPLDGMDEEPFQGLSWFIDGVPVNELKRGIGGRSWLLAANLLAEIVRKRDVQTARNLAMHYIVTGNVKCGAIGIVDLGNKVELATDKNFKNLKWIIPKENDMDIPKRKIEKPATLEEAYKLIESMQSVATRSLFNALHNADFKEAKVQHEKMGADIYALERDTLERDTDVPEYDTGYSTLEVVAREIENCRKDVAISEAERERKIGNLNEIMQWLRQENVDCAMLFYLLAQTENDAALAALVSCYPINAIDANGLTAVDLALNAGKYDVAKKLHAVGGVCNPRVGGNMKLFRAIIGFISETVDADVAEEDTMHEMIIQAIECGFPVTNCVDLPMTIKNKFGIKEEGFLHCDLLGCAIYRNAFGLAEVCIRNWPQAENHSHWIWEYDSKHHYVRHIASSAVEYLDMKLKKDEAARLYSEEWDKIRALLDENGIR